MGPASIKMELELELVETAMLGFVHVVETCFHSVTWMNGSCCTLDPFHYFRVLLVFSRIVLNRGPWVGHVGKNVAIQLTSKMNKYKLALFFTEY